MHPPAEPVLAARQAARDGALLRVVWTIVLLLAFAVAWSARTPNSDLYMALAGGRDVAQGKLGRPDDWSYLTQGRVWINQSWLTGYLLYELHLVAGDNGLLAARTLLLAALAAGLLVWLRGRGASWSAAAATTAAVLLVCRYHLLLRGNLVTIVLTPWLLVLLDRHARGSAHWAWPIAAMLGVWAHCHGGYVFGLLVVGLWLLAHLLSAVLRRGGWTPLRWGGLAAAAAAALGSAVLLSPFGRQVVTQSLAMSRDNLWRTVKEWWPLVRGWTEFWGELGQGVSEIGSFCVFLAVAVILCARAAWRSRWLRDAVAADSVDEPNAPDASATPVAAGAGNATADATATVNAIVLANASEAAGRRSRAAFDLLLAAAAVAMAFVGRRFVPLAAIGLAWPAAWALDANWRAAFAAGLTTRRPAATVQRFGSRGWPAGLAAAVALLLLAYPTVILGYRADHPFYPNQTIEQRQIVAGQFPVAAARFMRDNELRGPVWHTYDDEGYIRLALPDVKVACGSRAQQIYTEQDLRRFRAMEDIRFLDQPFMQRRHEVFQKYGIRLVLLPAFRVWELAQSFIFDANWVPVFFDGDYCLLIHPVGGYELFADALLDGRVSIINPKDDPEGKQAQAQIRLGHIVYPDQVTYTRSRAMFLASPRLSSDSMPEADLFKTRAGWIDTAQKLKPTPVLYDLIDALSRRQRVPNWKLMIEYFEQEYLRLENMHNDGGDLANVLRCRLFAATRLAQYLEHEGEERRAFYMHDEAAAAASEIATLGFWWQM